MTNTNILSLVLTLTATQKGVIKSGNKTDIYLCKKAILKPVSNRTLGFPSTERPMKAILGLPLPLTVLPKGVTKVTFVYVKCVKAKTGVTSNLSVPRLRNNQCKQLYVCHLLLTATPKGGNKTFIFVKAPRLNPMSYRILGFLNYVQYD